IFTVLLGGNGVPIPAAVFNSANPMAVRYLQIIANGETLAPRQQIGSTANAMQAQNAYQATSAQFANNANDSGMLGGVAAANYLQTTQTAYDSDRLGGIAAANWQRALTVVSCPAGSFYNAIAQGGTAVCASAQASLAPPVTLNANLAGPVLAVTNGSTGAGISAASTSGVGLTVTAGGSDALYAAS